VQINAQYEGYPSKNGPALQSSFEHSLELKCRYLGIDGNGTFLNWFKRVDNTDVLINPEKPVGHYTVKHTGKESILNIIIFGKSKEKNKRIFYIDEFYFCKLVQADADVTKWFVKTGKPGFEFPSECEFGPIAGK